MSNTTATAFQPSAADVTRSTIPSQATLTVSPPPKHAATAAESTPVVTTELVNVPGIGDVDLNTASRSAAPKLVQASDGTWHVVITWTSRTKAHVGSAVAGVTLAAELASTYLLPAGSEYTHWIQVGIGVVGTVATWLGIASATNLPKFKKN